jgi:hypothetical protein
MEHSMDAGRNSGFPEARQALKYCSVDARMADDSRMESASNIAWLQPQSSCLVVANNIAGRTIFFMIFFEKPVCGCVGAHNLKY